MFRHTILSVAALSLAAGLFVSGCDQTTDPVSTTTNEQAVPQTLKGGSTEDILLIAPLTGTRQDPLASGTAKWNSRPDRVTFTCEVEDVTTSGDHEVLVNGVSIGFVNVVAGLGDLNLDSRRGDVIPTMVAGQRVQVRIPGGRAILKGTLH